MRRRHLEGSSMRSALFFGFLGIVFATSPFGGQFDAKCSFFWLLRERFCDVAVWRAVRCEVLFFLAFEGSFLRRRRLGGGEAKKMNKIIEMPF